MSAQLRLPASAPSRIGLTGNQANVSDRGTGRAGVYAVQREVLATFPEDQFLDWGRDVFPALLRRDARLLAHPIEGFCLGLDTPESYRRGMSMIDSGQVTLQ